MKKRILGLALAMLLLFCAAALGETNTQVKHYLMLGEDGYADQVTDDARTDTIVIVSLDTKYNRVILTSILRAPKKLRQFDDILCAGDADAHFPGVHAGARDIQAARKLGLRQAEIFTQRLDAFGCCYHFHHPFSIG